MKWEVNHQGKLTQSTPSLATNAQGLLESSLSSFGWTCNLIQSSGNLRIYKLTHPNEPGFTAKIHLGRIRKEEDRRSDKEKRIQLGSDDPRVTQQSDSDDSKTSILGLYVYGSNDPWNEAIFAAWQILPSMNYPGNPSLRLNIEWLKEAKNYGFAIKSNDSGNIICAFRPEFIHFYLKNSNEILEGSIPLPVPSLPKTNKSVDPLLSRNLIVYGAPGTGKSFVLQKQAEKNFELDKMERVTFHPTYSYQQFMGSYKPSPIYKDFSTTTITYKSDKVTPLEAPDNKEPLIDYSFVEGPFIKQLIYALSQPEENFLLIIEEINRANVAAVFGDVFQLLDRDKEGVSQYEISFNPDIQAYLNKYGISGEKIRLPKNLYIWATMNSADQGVMPLDTAFKRRWSFRYLSLEEKRDEVSTRTVKFQGLNLDWNHFRDTINSELKRLEVQEDRLLGPFFLSETELESEDAIKNKLLLYLRDDVVRHNATAFFSKSTFSDIIASYEKPERIFKIIDFNKPGIASLGTDEESDTAATE